MSSLTPVLAISKSIRNILLNHVPTLFSSPLSSVKTTSSRSRNVVDRVSRSILLVSLPSTSTWCTGVLVSSQGHVLTCAHAMSKSPRSILLHDHSTSATHSDVRLVHRCEGSLDLALLHCPSLSNRSFLSCPSIPSNTDSCNNYQPVLVLGHSEFPPDFRSESISSSPLPPTVTSGNVQCFTFLSILYHHHHTSLCPLNQVYCQNQLLR